MPSSLPPQRRPTIALTVAATAGIGVWSAVTARRGTVAPREQRVFRAVNGRPDELHVPLWPVMQMGSLAAVFVAAGIRQRHDRTGGDAAIVAAAGTAVWAGVKLVKPLVGRGRPAACLDDVRVRGAEQRGLGYPSGHSAVALTLAMLAPWSPTIRGPALAAATITGLSRIFVGAHLPLDVIGGWAIGLLAGSAVRSLGRP
jgi:undecaprenyl-diphosphatase